MELNAAYELFRGVLVGFQSIRNRRITYFIPYKWKEYVFHREHSWNYQSILGKGFFQEAKIKIKPVRQSFLTPPNPFGDDLVKEVPHDDYTVPQKAPFVTKWKHHQDAVYWKRLQRAQDQGIQFWQTKSFATMAYTTIQGELH